MSSAKAALESDTRTLAYEAGRRYGVRVNTISAGPFASRAATAIGFIGKMIEYSRRNSPLPRAARGLRGGRHRRVPGQPARRAPSPAPPSTSTTATTRWAWRWIRSRSRSRAECAASWPRAVPSRAGSPSWPAHSVPTRSGLASSPASCWSSKPAPATRCTTPSPSSPPPGWPTAVRRSRPPGPGGYSSPGTILFSGSLYLLALTGNGALGAITPFGGVAFIAGWATLAVGALRLPGDS